MRNPIFVALVLISLIANSQQISQSFNYSQNDVEINQAAGFDVLRLPNTTILSGEDDAGKPALPVAHYNILLPQGARATNVTLTMQQEQQIAGTYNIYPSQLPAYPNFEEPSAFIAQDPSVYSANTPFPQDHILEYETHIFRDYSYVSVSFTPFKYLPHSQQLFLLSQLSINIGYTVNGSNEEHKLRPYNHTDEAAYNNIEQSVHNPNDIDGFYPDVVTKINTYKSLSTVQGAAFSTSKMPSLEGHEVHYIIITNDTDISGASVGDFTTKFQEFANWKNQSGTPAKVITLDEIKANYTGVDVAEKIRKFIQDAHKYWNTEYVLLGGVGSIVPVRHIGNTSYAATDLYYSAIYPYEDNWNANGDFIFGNNGDTIDYTPDIAVGRAPVNTNEEVDTFLKKNFTYARFTSLATIPAQTAWLDRELMGYGAAFDTEWEYIYPPAVRIGYEIIQEHHNHTNIYGMFEYNEARNLPYLDDATWCLAYYPLQGSVCTDNGVDIMDFPDLTHNEFLNQINEGYNLINVLEHGGPYGLGLGATTNDEPNLTAQDFQNLTDTGKYGIFLSGGCHSAPIERDYYMGEQWVNAPGGGVSYFGNSADIDANVSYDFNKEFYNSLYLDNIFKQGWLYRFAGINSSTTNLRLCQLLGDPDLSIYTDSPTTMSVTHVTSITNGNQDFTVDVSGFPVGELVKVSLYKEGEVLGFVETDTFPVNINITPDTLGELTVTATCHNTEPYEATIDVTQIAGIHLYNSNITILDQNQNGLIEPGETIDVSVELSNTGDTGATFITSELTSTDLNTLITQTSSNYPDIAPGQTTSSITNYTFTASPLGYLGNVIPFELGIISANQGTFIEPFLLETNSSMIDIGNRSVLVNNKETNIFTSGDEVELFIDVHNYGTITSENITGVLSTNLASNIATISNSTEIYGAIGSFSQKTNPNAFVVDIEPGYTGQDLVFELTLTDVFGKANVFEVLLNEEDMPLIGDFHFTSTENTIRLLWRNAEWKIPFGQAPCPPVCPDPGPQWVNFELKGNNIYRSDTEFGAYQKINNSLIIGTSLYLDLGLNELTGYWYKISAVSLTGNESSIDDLVAYYANTSLANHGGFPIQTQPLGQLKGHSSPTVYDVDGDGTKEIFVTLKTEFAGGGNHGRILGFYETGQELFDIDGNATVVGGFAETEIGLRPKPAIGDIDNDGQAEVFSTGRKSVDNAVQGKLYGFHTVDNDNDNHPDRLWNDGEISIGHRVYRNPVLSDVNNDGFLEIIILDEQQRILIFDKDENLLGEKQVGSEDYSQGELTIADVDNDGFKEIILGCEDGNGNNQGALYIWNHNGNFNTDLDLIREFSTNERADNGAVLADIDGDGSYEVLTITKNGTQGRVYAINIEDGTFVNSNWAGANTVTIVNGQYQEHIMPRIAVGDIDSDGNLDVVYGSMDKLYALDNNGTVFPNFPIDINNSWESAPILADIDEDNDIEIIINSGGIINAYNFDGTPCFGWGLEANSGSPFVGAPFVGDIDNDGDNEVVACSEDFTTYVWDTSGNSNKIEWPSNRANAQNTAVYKEDCFYSSIGTIYITEGNTIWSTDRHIQGDLIVKSDADLTIKSEVTFTKDSKIVVEKGAKLTIDGGVLTSACGRLWKGIRVIGQKGLVQNSINQGTLILKNNAIISNAEMAIYAGDSPLNPANDTGAGGIIKIDNSKFMDNVVSVEMPNYYFENDSYIKTTVFETTDYLSGINLVPETSILLWDVGTIVIEDNTFLTLSGIEPYTNTYNLSEQGNGIELYNSRAYILNNNFENLNSAIKAQGFGSFFSIAFVDIEDNSFVNNWNAVNLNSIDGVKIASNQVNVFGTFLDGQGVDGSSGLYIVNSNGFQIENNYFFSITPLSFSTGIFIRGCKASNDIYKNNFTDLYTGVFAMGENTVPSPIINGSVEGLTITCNDFYTNSTDIYIAPKSNIAKYQGSDQASAGNKFYPECSGTYKEFDNLGSIQINYLGETPSEYLPDCNFNVNVFNNSTHNDCPDLLGLTGSPSEIAVLDNEIATTKSVLIAIIDGGDTEGLNETIDETQNNEALILRNELLSDSPFLSDTIMVKSAVIEDILPSVMVKDVLAANPKAAKSEKVQTALDNRLNQLPNYMRNEIDLGKSILSQKELLESQLSKDIHKREHLVNTRLNSFMRDTLGLSMDSLRLLLINESQVRIQRNYQLIDRYLSIGDIQNAQTTLSNMEQVFEFTLKEQNEHNQLSELFDVKISLKNSGKNWFELDASQEAVVNSLANDSTSIAGMQSRAVLSLINNFDYALPIPAKELGNRSSFVSEIIEEKFAVFPELATDHFIIDYALNRDEMTKGVEIFIFDSNDKEMHKLPVKTIANQFLIECEKWKEGVYWVVKMIHGQIILKEKVTIDRGGIFEQVSNSNILNEQSYLKIYPNPINDYFFVKTNLSTGTNLKVTSLLGVTIKTFTIEDSLTKISTSSWSSGIYFVSLSKDDKLSDTIKIIIN